MQTFNQFFEDPLIESLENPAEWFETESSDPPNRYDYLIQQKSNNYGIRFVRLSTKGIYRMDFGLVPNAKMKRGIVKKGDLSAVLSAGVDIMDRLETIAPDIKAVAINLPKSINRNLITLLDKVLKRKLRGTFRPIDISSNDLEVPDRDEKYLFFYRRDISPSIIKKIKVFKDILGDRDLENLTSSDLSSIQTLRPNILRFSTKNKNKDTDSDGQDSFKPDVTAQVSVDMPLQNDAGEGQSEHTDIYKKRGIIPAKEKYSLEEAKLAYYKFALFYDLYHSYGNNYRAADYFDISLPEDVEKYYYYADYISKKSDKYYESSVRVAILNFLGFRTNHMYDLYDMRKSKRLGSTFAYNNKVKEAVHRLDPNPKTMPDLETFIDVYENTDKYLSKYPILDIINEKRRKKDKKLLFNRTVLETKDSGVLPENSLLSILASLDRNTGYSIKERKTEDKKKPFVKDIDVGDRQYVSDALVNDVISYLKTLSNEDARLAFESLPDSIKYSFRMGIYSKDPVVFEARWLDAWAMAGDNFSQYISSKTLSGFGPNGDVSNYWISENDRHEDRYIPALAEGDVTRRNYQIMYQKSQDFFKGRFGKKYEGKTIKLYRGIGVYPVDGYIPGAIESWTTQMSTAKTFAKMMSDNGSGTILYAEVPIEHIFGSFESFSDFFPPESELKGKKEYMVIGGTFEQGTQIFEFDPIKKETKDRLMTFSVHKRIYEDERGEKRELDVLFKDSADYDKLNSRGTLGKGIDPKEASVKGVNSNYYERKDREKSK